MRSFFNILDRLVLNKYFFWIFTTLLIISLLISFSLKINLSNVLGIYSIDKYLLNFGIEAKNGGVVNDLRTHWKTWSSWISWPWWKSLLCCLPCTKYWSRHSSAVFWFYCWFSRSCNHDFNGYSYKERKTNIWPITKITAISPLHIKYLN